jgi:hypothetical protein
MRALLLVLLVVLTGCDDRWYPTSYPVEVAILTEVPDRAPWQAGVEMWNDAVGAEVFHLRFEPGGDDTACGRVNVVITNEGMRTLLGETRAKGPRPCNARLKIRADLKAWEIPVVLGHELGHVLLGSQHDEDPESILSTKAADMPGVAHVTGELVETVRDLMAVRE